MHKKFRPTKASALNLCLLFAPILMMNSPAAAQSIQTRPLQVSEGASRCVGYSIAPTSVNSPPALKVSSQCTGRVSTLVCSYDAPLRPPLAARQGLWDCRGKTFTRHGSSWSLPYAHAPSRIYYVSTCRSSNARCENTLLQLVSSIDGRRDSRLVPSNLTPAPASEQRCQFTVNGECIPLRSPRG